MNKKEIILSTLLVLALPVVAFAQGADPISKAIKAATGVLTTILYAAAILFIVVAAFKFLTAGGEPEKVSSARDSVIYALIAVVVAVAAQGLVTLVQTWGA